MELCWSNNQLLFVIGMELLTLKNGVISLKMELCWSNNQLLFVIGMELLNLKNGVINLKRGYKSEKWSY